MHELGVVMEVVKQVEQFAAENALTDHIEALVLQIGELSSMIPAYVEAVYPAAAEGTILEQARLEVEILPANALCKACGKVFRAKEHKGVCPACGGKELELLGGREFCIKEIAVAPPEKGTEKGT
ncbi:MAG: hydrogenase maturation nickel metallochaperone HypA [Clostridiales Family XIII bacterium]|jgi:hydrogenase nickel incorporation protein HypA/HybF|nr:hydrogenase maturation nickel metallochaperone HypA [Clostridiales Family XIII bacterium]